jgi:PEP-CTERM motif
MFATFRNTAIGAAALGLCAGLALPAQAAFIVTLQQVGANVVATGSGTIDLTGLTPDSTAPFSSGIIPNIGAIAIGMPIFESDNFYLGFSGPSSFGSGVGTFPSSSGSGDKVVIDGDLLAVPAGYVSGDPLADMSTYNNATFASLGVTPGTYEWTWGSGPDADSFTLEIGAVPEPGSLPLLAMGLAGLGLVVRTRRA